MHRAHNPWTIQRPPRHRGRSRGSLLIVALLLSAIIGISLASYLRLAVSSLNAANRGFYASACAELAECGVEEAMAAFYQHSTGTNVTAAWAGWQTAGTDATRTFTGFSPGPNATGEVRVYVRNYTLSNPPLIVAKATVRPPNGSAIERTLEVTCRPRGLFSRGMVARDRITWTAGPRVDSWNSDPDGDPSTPAVPYSSGIAQTNGSIACASRANGAISLAFGKVYGTVSSGGGTISHGSGAIVSGSFDGTGVDPRRLSQDFSATFPERTTPSPATMNLVTSRPATGTTFPRAGDLPEPDGKYYYFFAVGTDINLGAGDVIFIDASCVFIFTNHSGVPCITTSGSGSITVNPSAGLIVYTNGNISSSGNAFINRNGQPGNLIIYGTNTQPGRQTVSISGVGGGGAAFYMPNADLTISGNGSIHGAFVANTITMSGSADFHFDQALSNLGGGTGVYVSKWKQLQSPAERSTYTTQLNF